MIKAHDGVKKEFRKRFIEGEGWSIDEVEIGTPVADGQTVISSPPTGPPLPVVLTIADVSLPLARQVVEANGLIVVPSSFLNETQLEDLKINPESVTPPAETTTPAKKGKLTEAQAIKAVATAASFEELNALTRDETRMSVLSAAEQRAAELKEQGKQ